MTKFTGSIPNKKVGLLFYYGGHGTYSWVKDAKEGETIGTMCGPNMRETELKRLVNGILGPQPPRRKYPRADTNVLMMFDMCHAGAMTVRHEDRTQQNRGVYA